MRVLVFVVAVLATTPFVERPAAAQSGGWCAYLNYDHGGARNCGFATLQQCLDDVRGVGGNCSPSPYYERPSYPRYRPGYPY